MDQGYFAGVGNIYRAEILFVAGVHPEVKGRDLSRPEFDRIWSASVSLMQRGFQTGSILTVDPAEAAALGKPNLRRYIYNSATCGRCGARVQSWDVASRTCYACPQCQSRDSRVTESPSAADPKLFNSHCAGETLQTRLATPQKLRVAELREALLAAGLTPSGKKADLVAMYTAHLAEGGKDKREGIGDGRASPPAVAGVVTPTAATPTTVRAMRSARAAAADKRAAGESAAVEHVADYEEGLEEGAAPWVQVGDGGYGELLFPEDEEKESEAPPTTPPKAKREPQAQATGKRKRSRASA